MQTKQRIVETKTPCPRCGGPLHMRQVGHMIAESDAVVKWTDDRRFCPRGCQYTHDEVVE